LEGLLYMPMLRSKAGEAVALTHLAEAMKRHVFPIAHLTQFPPATFAAATTAAWCGRRMALDGQFQSDMLGSTRAFEQMFDQLGKHQVALIPSIECHAMTPYLTTVQSVRNRYAPGVLLKARPRELQDALAWCTAQGWAVPETDLLVNLGDIAGYDAETLASAVVRAMLDHIADPSPWRSLTLGASAAPRDDRGLKPGRNVVPRTEWKVWRAVAQSIPQPLNYADCLTAHPDLADPPGYAVARGLVSVRYTAADEWIILRGGPIGTAAPHAMASQYFAHARALAADPKFGGVKACWADDRIREIARGSPGGGSRSVWTTIVASRHLTLVAGQMCGDHVLKHLSG
jgi:Beta protein